MRKLQERRRSSSKGGASFVFRGAIKGVERICFPNRGKYRGSLLVVWIAVDPSLEAMSETFWAFAILLRPESQ